MTEVLSYFKRCLDYFHNFDLFLSMHVIDSQGIRFQKVKSKTPGPGSYNLSKRSDWLREVHNKPEQEVEQGVLVKDGSVSVDQLCSH